MPGRKVSPSKAPRIRWGTPASRLGAIWWRRVADEWPRINLSKPVPAGVPGRS